MNVRKPVDYSAMFAALDIMDVLLREGPTLSKDLKRLAGFGGGGMKGFDTAITHLQMQTYNHGPQLRIRP